MESYINPNRRQFLKYGLYSYVAAGLSCGFGLSGCRTGKDSAKPSNLIIISIDTLRADHLSCYGYARPTSTVLDKLATRGLLFEDVTSTSPWTLPSHGSLLTGYYPGRIGLNTENCALSQNVETMASLFSKSGYATAAVVNSFYLSRKYDLDRGFDDYKYVEEDQRRLGATPRILDWSKAWMRKNRKKPFFLFIHLFDVHGDYRSLPEYEKQFVSPYAGRANGSTIQLSAFRRGLFPMKQADVKHVTELYDAGIRQIDDQLAGLFDFLQEQRLSQKSMLIVTSDHGEEFLDHGGVLHGKTQYQELLHVPLIMCGPSIPENKRINSMVSLVDVMPTVLNMFGMSTTTNFDGCDLCPLWQVPGVALPERCIFAEADHNNITDNIKRAVRKSKFKLHYNVLTKEIELYDLSLDPQESVNIASEHDAIVKPLMRELVTFMQNSTVNKRTVPLSPENIDKLKSLGYLQ